MVSGDGVVMNITAVMWDAYVPLMREAAENCGASLKIYANKNLEESPELCLDVIASAENADVILIYRTTHRFWDILLEEMDKLRGSKQIICVGHDISYWSFSTVEPDVVTETYRYLTNNGRENFHRLMLFLQVHFGERNISILPPVEIPWQGIVHPDAGDRIFSSIDEYLAWYPIKEGEPYVGLLMSRVVWVSSNHSIEGTIVACLENEENLNVIPVFTNSIEDDTTGSLNIAGCISRYFIQNGIPVVDAVIKSVSFMVGKTTGSSPADSAKSGTELLASLNIPVFQPITAFYATLEEWRNSNGLSADITWTVAMPEFEGMIEPIIIGSTRSDKSSEYERVAILERCRKVAARVRRRVDLRRTPAAKRKVVFLLNNNPCAGVEANIGSAVHLDAVESVVLILQRMKEAGYTINPPISGKELTEMFLAKKAISEFRWTTKSEIVKSGGTVYRMPKSMYQKYFDTLSPAVKEKMIATWGEPPGEGMVLDDELLITGLSFGNAIVAVQPKRGCFGAQCDGSVCKILHDPECPPTHQYLATYYYFSEIFKADAIVHVGTHGNLEFLPGKGTALSGNCFPDIAIGKSPLLYIYNTDNPPEGTIAKRRACATLIGHMQSVMDSSSLYDELETLDQLLSQYETARLDTARCHALHHMILDAAFASNLTNLGISMDMPMDEVVRKCHEALSGIRNSRIDVGMHIFGTFPKGEKRIQMISSILRYDSGEKTAALRPTVAKMYGLSVSDLLQNTGSFNTKFGMSNGALIEWLDEIGKTVVQMTIHGNTAEEIACTLKTASSPNLMILMERICDLDARITASSEMDSLLNGLSGGYILSGPSGLATRGHDEVLPSGRNFYSLDPYRVPTTSAWRVGSRLADACIDKYLNEEGRFPETIAFYWMSSDIMTADGEMMAELFSLLGVVPVWEKNGQVRSFSILSKEQLTHPRIDVTVRMSGILRDNFTNAIDLIDKAVSAVSGLDEPFEINFVRKHVVLEMDRGSEFSAATARIFSAKPGAYISGVSLAVLAGAWRTEKDLAEIYIASNGYAYGNGRNGEEAHEQFAANLETVNVTFNNTVSDEHDLLGCCCYYGNQGGMTVASRYLSGKEVKAYYGDTRDAEVVTVGTLADELRRVVRTKLLNPKWIDGMKEHGYKGAADIMQRVVRVYGWEASTQEVDDWIFDDITETFVNDPDMKQFFEENNPYALEEISRRLLEAESRGLWSPKPEVLDKLRESYVEIESWLEEKAGDGEYQGGSVDVVTADEIAGWGDSIAEVMEKIHRRKMQ